MNSSVCKTVKYEGCNYTMMVSLLLMFRKATVDSGHSGWCNFPDSVSSLAPTLALLDTCGSCLHISWPFATVPSINSICGMKVFVGNTVL